MQIKAKCKYDIDSHKALARYGMFKKADPKKRMIFWTVAYAVLVAVIILESIAFGVNTLLFVCLGVALFVWLLECYLYFVLPRIRYNALAEMKDIENEYTFCDDALLVSTQSEKYNADAEIKYSLIVRVVETSRYYFIYFNNMQVFLIDKSTIAGGTAEEIREKLMPLLGKRYILCNY